MTLHEPRSVIFVDDDEAVRAAYSQALALAGLQPLLFANAHSALTAIDNTFEGVVVTDLRMPRMDGSELQRRIKAIDPELPVILITGHGDIEHAVLSLQAGAYDFITKPCPPEKLIEAIRRALDHRALMLDNRRMRELAEIDETELPILGESAAMRALRGLVHQIGDTDAHVLIEGEGGAGKAYVARILHRISGRPRRAYAQAACATITDVTLEGQLFGDGGRSPGRARPGLLESANGGTLVLRDVDAASPSLQNALARVMDERTYLPAGATQPRPFSCRMIGITRHDLGALVEAEKFRADLFYSLSMVRIRIPPLRERRTDIPLLFATFQEDAAKRFNRQPPSLSSSVRRKLIDYDWPGNLLELQRFADRVVLGIEALEAPAPTDERSSLPELVDDFEASVIRDTLRMTAGNTQAAIQKLKIPRKTFYDKVRRYAIDLRSFRSASG